MLPCMYVWLHSLAQSYMLQEDENMDHGNRATSARPKFGHFGKFGETRAYKPSCFPLPRGERQLMKIVPC